MPDQNPASAYQSQAVQTANGPHLLLMLCDRMSVDIARAEVALEGSDNKAANEHLQHAQKIVRMLRNALRPGRFRGRLRAALRLRLLRGPSRQGQPGEGPRRWCGNAPSWFGRSTRPGVRR